MSKNNQVIKAENVENNEYLLDYMDGLFDNEKTKLEQTIKYFATNYIFKKVIKEWYFKYRDNVVVKEYETIVNTYINEIGSNSNEFGEVRPLLHYINSRKEWLTKHGNHEIIKELEMLIENCKNEIRTLFFENGDNFNEHLKNAILELVQDDFYTLIYHQ